MLTMPTSERSTGGRTIIGLAAGVLLALANAPAADAHDIEMPRERLRKDVERLTETLRYYRSKPAVPAEIETEDDQRRLLGAAEIEFALGDGERALEILMGRLADPRFQAMSEYVATLLLTSEILENRGEDAGAMLYSEVALRKGGSPEQMAEAGARWFRVARRSRRLGRRSEMYELWKRQGGEAAAAGEQASQVRYEVAFALRADGRYAETLKLLREVPSDSAFGSRAAYLAGVVFVEYGDLANAERWFAAIMDWPMPALPEDHPQVAIERRVRELAALSAGRLRFERSDLGGAVEAYARVPPSSPYGAEACWERAYLSLERDEQRGALKQFQCVVDLGARGQRGAEARLFKASLLAHLKRYSASIRSYEALQDSLSDEHALFAKAADTIDRPAQFLFDAVERSASRTSEAEPVSPGPATLFADAWTNDVDRAYRIDRDAKFSNEAVDRILADLDRITEAVRGDGAFVGFRVRRQYLELLLREVRHLEGHAGEASNKTRSAHASTAVVASAGHDHADDLEAFRQTIEHLRKLGRAIEADLVALAHEEERRRKEALTELRSLRRDVLSIRSDLVALERAADRPIEGVARQAIQQIQSALRDAAMKAEFGVLDTFWLRKQHRTRAVEALLQQQKETERQLNEALDTAP